MYATDILKKDFEKALSEIDFNEPYNPFKTPFMKALFLGQTWLAAKFLKDDEDDVNEELEGAEKYFRMYEETADSAYKDMSNDELRHAGILIKKHIAKTSDTEKKDKLNALEHKRLEMMKKISMATVPVKSE